MSTSSTWTRSMPWASRAAGRSPCSSTPDGTPFWGGTYFPDTPRFGRPSFRQILTEIARLWQAEPGKIAANLAHIREALQRQPPAKPPVALSLEQLDAAGRLLLEAVDTSAWRLPRRPQIPPDPRLRIPLAALPPHRQPALPPGRHHHPDPSLPGRHLRPSRRRFCPLQRRCPLAGAAFREDAV